MKRGYISIDNPGGRIMSLAQKMIDLCDKIKRNKNINKHIEKYSIFEDIHLGEKNVHELKGFEQGLYRIILNDLNKSKNTYVMKKDIELGKLKRELSNKDKKIDEQTKKIKKLKRENSVLRTKNSDLQMKVSEYEFELSNYKNKENSETKTEQCEEIRESQLSEYPLPNVEFSAGFLSLWSKENEITGKRSRSYEDHEFEDRKCSKETERHHESEVWFGDNVTKSFSPVGGSETPVSHRSRPNSFGSQRSRPNSFPSEKCSFTSEKCTLSDDELCVGFGMLSMI
eukprot:UN23639